MTLVPGPLSLALFPRIPIRASWPWKGLSDEPTLVADGTGKGLLGGPGTDQIAAGSVFMSGVCLSKEPACAGKALGGRAWSSSVGSAWLGTARDTV